MNHTNSLALEDTGERMVPEFSGRPTFWEHVYRYAFAADFVKGKRVLDIACGEGYGGAALKKAGAAHVIGVDIAEDVCLHARNRYGLDTRLGTAGQIPLGDASVDVVVSFETIEHVPDTPRFLDECVRVLVPGGRLIISTPNKDIYARVGVARNPYHCSEMTEVEFASALRSRFHDLHFYTQGPYSAAWWSTRALICENTPWNRIPGFWRMRRAFQYKFSPEAISDPTDEQRKSILELILRVARRPHQLLNPFALRSEREWAREKPTYIIATGIR
ncbi:MAG: class I SAM-dependent methyltransferase [Candidatus Acidiferrales bacterium]